MGIGIGIWIWIGIFVLITGAFTLAAATGWRFWRDAKRMLRHVPRRNEDFIRFWD